MNDPRISLGMYPAKASASIFNIIEARLASVLDEAGIGPAQQPDAQVVRHMCGITLAIAPVNRWRYLATPVIGDPAVPAGITIR